jgi:Lysozyme inhibitor LprI
VKQNYVLAEKFACHAEYEYGSGAEIGKEDFDFIKRQARNELQQLEAGRASGARAPVGLCSSFYQETKDDWCQPFEVKAERSLAIHRVMDRIAPGDGEQRSELDRLLKAESVFSEVETAEIAQDGDSAAIWDWRATRTIDQEFFSILDGLFDQNLPNVSEAAFSSDDQRLNDAYRNVKVWGTQNKADVQRVERAWIVYRDAWTRFVEADFPSHSWRDVADVLTRNRASMLGCLGEGRPYQEFKNGHPECGN